MAREKRKRHAARKQRAFANLLRPPEFSPPVPEAPQVKSITLAKPSPKLAHAQSPKPLFYRDRRNPNKSYLIMSPYKTPRYETTQWIYKYEIAKDEYNKFAKYPKECNLEWPIHFIDDSTNMLCIFSAFTVRQRYVLWMLHLETAEWQKTEISLQHNFFPHNFNSWNQTGIKMFHDAESGLIHSFNFENKHFESFKFWQKGEQMMFIGKQNRIISFDGNKVRTYDEMKCAEGPPVKKRKLNNGRTSNMEWSSGEEVQTYFQGKAVDIHNDLGINSFVLFLKLDYIVMVLHNANVIYEWEVYCLDVFNHSYNWYKCS